MRNKKQQNHKREPDAIPIGGVYVIGGQELADTAAKLKKERKIPPLADFLRMMAKAYEEKANEG